MEREEIDALGRAAQERAIEAARKNFVDTRIPLFVWEAYARCRHGDIPLPEWVLIHFDETARRLGALDEKARSGNLPRDHRAETIAAFGMNVEGRGSVFARYADRWPGDWEWVAIGESVAEHVRAGKMVKSAIGDVVEQLACEYAVAAPGPKAVPSEDAVKAAWYRYKAAFPLRAKKMR
ncbi:MAG TPA: hypothetical protein VFC56_12765 [Stellaceae bacterium]|nr:hypothetical protein [Stellaceae bacterium]